MARLTDQNTEQTGQHRTGGQDRTDNIQTDTETDNRQTERRTRQTERQT